MTGGTDGIGKQSPAKPPWPASSPSLSAAMRKRASRGHELRRASRNADVHFVSADLGLISDIDRLVEQLTPRLPNLEFLVHCAGVVQAQYQLTAEGVESNFAVDYLGRFALTESLLPALAAGGLGGDPARILVIGGAAQNGKIHFDDVNLEGKFNILRVVSQFCEANDVFVIELARQIAAAQPPSHVTVTTLKVGAVRTIRRQFPLMKLLVPR